MILQAEQIGQTINRGFDFGAAIGISLVVIIGLGLGYYFVMRWILNRQSKDMTDGFEKLDTTLKEQHKERNDLYERDRQEKIEASKALTAHVEKIGSGLADLHDIVRDHEREIKDLKDGHERLRQDVDKLKDKGN